MVPKRLKTIRFRLPLMFLLIVLLPAILISLISSRIELNGARKRIMSQLESVIALKKASIAVWVRSLNADLEEAIRSENSNWHGFVVLSRSPSMELLFDTSYGKIRQRFTRLMEETRRFEILLLLDLQGKVCFSTRPELEGEVFKSQEFFRMGRQAFSISPVANVFHPGTWSVVAALPFFDDKDQLVGVVAGVASVERLNHIMLERSGLGETGETYLVSRTFRVLTEMRFTGKPDVHWNGEGMLKGLAVKNRDSLACTKFMGKELIGVYQYLPELQVHFFAVQARSEAFQSTYTALRMMVIITLVVVCVALFVGSVFSHKVTSRLSLLADAAKKITDGNFDVATPVTKNDEIGNLAAAFNIMTKTIHESFRKIQAQQFELTAAKGRLETANMRLEERVAKRTEDLASAYTGLQQQMAVRQRAEEKLRKYAETQKVLLLEVNHRVKNNLTAIIGLLYKEQDRAEARGLTDYAKVLDALRNRIEGLSTVHNLLSASGWRPLSLSRLCRELVEAGLRSAPLGVHISMDIEDSPVRVNSNQAHHLTLVINELVINTLKYALSDRDTVGIAVRILREKDDIIVTYRDDGPGYPVAMTKGDFSRSNVGFDLINGIVKESLKGRVILSNDQGAVTKLVFKADRGIEASENGP